MSAGERRVPFGDRPVWRERLGTYMLGVSIGLLLVGILFWGRYQASQRQRAAQRPAESTAAPGTNNPPTAGP